MASKKAGDKPDDEKPEAPVCRLCGELVAFPDFECHSRPGKHVVPIKTYYHPGAVHLHPVMARRAFRPTLVLKHPIERFDNLQQRAVNESGLSVTCDFGKYSTTNAEEQFYLDRHPELKSGEEGLAMWRSIYLEVAQQSDLAKQELEDVNRQLREQKSLLERTQANAGA